jgi:hypothetical protein
VIEWDKAPKFMTEQALTHFRLSQHSNDPEEFSSFKDQIRTSSLHEHTSQDHRLRPSVMVPLTMEDLLRDKQIQVRRPSTLMRLAVQLNDVQDQQRSSDGHVDYQAIVMTPSATDENHVSP